MTSSHRRPARDNVAAWGGDLIHARLGAYPTGFGAAYAYDTGRWRVRFVWGGTETVVSGGGFIETFTDGLKGVFTSARAAGASARKGAWVEPPRMADPGRIPEWIDGLLSPVIGGGANGLGLSDFGLAYNFTDHTWRCVLRQGPARWEARHKYIEDAVAQAAYRAMGR
jgi:hypothetical protein